MKTLLHSLVQLRKSTVARNALWMYGVQISSILMPLITLPYLSRVLAPEHIGLISFAQSFIWYFQTLTEYGFNLTATRQVAVCLNDPEKVAEVFTATFGAKLLLTIAAVVILAGVVFATPRLRTDWPIFFVSFLGVIGNVMFPLWLYQGLQKMEFVALRDLLSKLLALVALFLLVRSDEDYLLAAAIPSMGLLLAGVIGLVQATTLLNSPFRLPTFAGVTGALKAGWPVFLSMAALSLTSSTNMFILGWITTKEEVAYFGQAQRIIVALRGLVAPMSVAIYPYISRKASISKSSTIQFLDRYAWILSLPFLLMSVVLLITAPYIVKIVLGPKYEASIILLQLMSFSPFLLSLSHCYSTYFMLAFGYEKEWFRIILLSVVVNFVLLATTITVMRPSLAVAVVWTALDLFTTAMFYNFYRRRPNWAD